MGVEVKTKLPLKILAVLALIMGVLSILHSKKIDLGCG